MRPRARYSAQSSKNDFQAIKLVCPPARIIERFEQAVFPLDQRIENNEAESRTLAVLRDALLPKLISGELRVPDAEQLVRRSDVMNVCTCGSSSSRQTSSR